jgi:hypothetical protein
MESIGITNDNQLKMQLLKTFNDQFMQFTDDIITVFPDDADLRLAKNAFIFFRKANPKVLIDIWHRYVSLKYKDIIQAGDVSFFLEKDYNDDFVYLNEWSARTLEGVNRLRAPLKNMNLENQEKAMKYCQNLTSLSLLYWK